MERVIGDDDLLEEILLRLPAEIVHACKPVSKRWCSLISSLRFRKRHSSYNLLHPSRINNSKLLWFDHEERSVITLLNIDNGVVKISDIESARLLYSIRPYYDKLRQKIVKSREIDFRICDSYNGLFLISLRTKRKEPKKIDFHWKEIYYLVCNPLTNEYQELPLLREHKLSPFTQLAFAPSKHNGLYKVVVAYTNQAPYVDSSECILQVYSSQTRAWKNSGRLRRRGLYRYKYVVWDNCLLLVGKGTWTGQVCVLDLERLHISYPSSLLPDSIEKNEKRMIRYFGESGGVLYVIAEDDKCNLGRERSNYMLWELTGIDGSWKDKFQFNTEKDFIILHVHRDGEHVRLLMWDVSARKVYYCFNGDTQCLQEAGDVPSRSLQWNIRYHTPTLYPLEK